MANFAQRNRRQRSVKPCVVASPTQSVGAFGPSAQGAKPQTADNDNNDDENENNDDNDDYYDKENDETVIGGSKTVVGGKKRVMCSNNEAVKEAYHCLPGPARSRLYLV